MRRAGRKTFAWCAPRKGAISVRAPLCLAASTKDAALSAIPRPTLIGTRIPSTAGSAIAPPGRTARMGLLARRARRTRSAPTPVKTSTPTMPTSCLARAAPAPATLAPSAPRTAAATRATTPTQAMRIRIARRSRAGLARAAPTHLAWAAQLVRSATSACPSRTAKSCAPSIGPWLASCSCLRSPSSYALGRAVASSSASPSRTSAKRMTRSSSPLAARTGSQIFTFRGR
mmetsp:Transcript_44717/g.129234  ORF Transcript_44717/g.129234 Transcript_44717/m.129234 type:complete len:230 (-) Transcript_44717:430-1119(-)